MTDTKHSAELATCDFCRASEVPVRRKYLYRENKEREIGDGFTITRYCHECGLKSENADTNHTDSVEATIEKLAGGFETWDSFFSGLSIQQETEEDTAKLYEVYLIDYIKDALYTLQARTSQQVSDAYTKGRSDEAKTCTGCQGRCEQQVEEAVRKERERIEEQVLTPLYEKIDKWFQEKHDIIGQGALAAVFEEALQALTPNHQD